MQPSTANKISSNPDKYPSRRPGQHAEVLPRLEPVVYSRDFAAAPLSSECIDQYRNNGFVVLEQLFSGQEIAVLQRELEQLRVDDRIKGLDETICEPDSNAVRSIFSVHTLSKLLGALATDTRLVLLAEYLLGDQVYMHQSRLNYKPGFRGKEFYWHSDFETWHVEDGMP
ncbi:MAG: phytanoyl-CoA dioxygenase family protein, partial [Pseudohongiellaceae bacterium]